jgi:hypothetical protein
VLASVPEDAVGLVTVSAAVTPEQEQEAAVDDVGDVGDVELFVHLPGALSTALWRRAQLDGCTMAAVMRTALCMYLGLEPRS